ncbi:MAG: CinA family protein [Ketobacteraceae bacterium]|nr:CinA family protein [Ketobacteraceae bacterium]
MTSILTDKGLLEGMAVTLGELLKETGLSVATAESCTGGWVAQTITSVPGSSEWFDRGFVTYSNEAKREMLGVRAQALKKYGAVSEKVVLDMALGAVRKSGAAMSVSVSGVAGPDGGTEEKPVGTVWFAWSFGDQAEASVMRFYGDRHQVRYGAVMVALQGLIARIPLWLKQRSA